MSTSIPFTPQANQVFTFSPVIAGVTYNASVTYNVAGQRYYLNLTDTGGNLILCRAVCSSGPRYQASCTWANGFGLVTTSAPHNIPVGSCGNWRLSETGTAFDGDWQVLSTGPTTLQFPLPNPELEQTVNGEIFQPLNLVGGVLPGWLLFRYDTLSFEFES